jgi:hypothetical protein
MIVGGDPASLARRAGIEDAWNELKRLTVTKPRQAEALSGLGLLEDTLAAVVTDFEQCPCRRRDLLAEAADQVRVVAPVGRQVSECVRPGEVGPEVEHPADIGKIPACFARRGGRVMKDPNSTGRRSILIVRASRRRAAGRLRTVRCSG